LWLQQAARHAQGWVVTRDEFVAATEQLLAEILRTEDARQLDALARVDALLVYAKAVEL
jgi:hypothetical protein